MNSTSVSGSNGSNVSGTFGPVVGYNVNEKFTVGLGLNYTANTVTNEQSITGGTFELQDKTSLFTIAPFLRYMKKVDEDFLLYGQVTVGFGFGKNESEELDFGQGNTITVDNVTSDVNTFAGSVGPGIVYVMSPRWALNADWGALRYESRTLKADAPGAEGVTTNTFGLGLTPGALSFGLNWLF